MDPTGAGTLHVAAIPYPGRGHMNPMLNLCRRLLLSSSTNLTVSFIATQEWVDLISNSLLPPNLRFVPIPNVLPSELTRGADFVGFVQAVRTRLRAPVEDALDRAGPTVSLVIADSILPWAAEVCGDRGLPVAALWTHSASVLLAFLRFGSRLLDHAAAAGQHLISSKEDEALAYIPRVATPNFAGMLSERSEFEILKGFLDKFSWLNKAQGLLLSSFYELESKAIDNLKPYLSIPIYSPGPLIPFMTPARTDTKVSYFKWLDSQPDHSVLYIALGSFLSASTVQADEMVAGLNTSGARYLWVARDEQQQLKHVDGGVGLVVPWCDQLRVLCHPSVGGFLTHCGWSSTVEGIYAGVPMLTYPLIWDQYPNSKQIVDELRIGLRLKDEESERVVGKEEVAELVRELMDLEGEESKARRRRAAELKELCEAAVKEGGSSCNSLDAFLQVAMCKK